MEGSRGRVGRGLEERLESRSREGDLVVDLDDLGSREARGGTHDLKQLGILGRCCFGKRNRRPWLLRQRQRGKRRSQAPALLQRMDQRKLGRRRRVGRRRRHRRSRHNVCSMNGRPRVCSHSSRYLSLHQVLRRSHSRGGRGRESRHSHHVCHRSRSVVHVALWCCVWSSA